MSLVSHILSIPVMVMIPLIMGLFVISPLCPSNEIFIRRFVKSTIVAHLLYVLCFWLGYENGFEALYSPYWIKPLGIKFGFVMDNLSLVMSVLTALIFTLAVIASKSYIKNAQKWYYALLLLFETTILGIFNAADIFLFFLFWELELIPAYFLIAKWGEGQSSKKSAMKFVLFTFIGSLFMLLGLLILHYFNFLSSGSLNGQISQYDLSGVALNLQLLISLLLLIGFGVKLPMVPIHTWLPAAHTDAPTPVSMLLAGVLLKTGAYAIIRFNLEVLPNIFVYLAPILAVVALINIIYASILAYAQTDIKRIVAYSSISHMGLILLGITSLNIIGYTGAVFHMVAHGLITSGLFMICGIVYLRCKTRNIKELSGIASSAPRFFGFATLIILAAIGLPLFAGFVGEVVTFIGALASELTDSMKFIAILSLPMLILSSCYLLKFLHKSFFGLPCESKPASDILSHEFVVLALIVLLLLLFGCYPQALINVIGSASVFNGVVPW